MIRKIFCGIFLLLLASLNAWGEEKSPFLGTITTDKVNVRAGQHVNFEVLMRLNSGYEVVVVGKSYDWYQIKLPEDADSFVSEKYLVVKDGIGVIGANQVNVRAAPTERASVIGQLNKGVRVFVKEYVSGWYKIKPVEGVHGWVLTKFVAYKSGEIPAPKIVQLPLKVKEPLPAEQPKAKEEKKKEPPLFSAVGRIEDVGRSVPSKGIRYKLIVDNKTIYYLEGDKALLDQSVHYTVRVEGTLKADPEKHFKYPVIVVFTINSLL